MDALPPAPHAQQAMLDSIIGDTLPIARSRIVLWGVDMQRDFMLPGGALYVPGAERLIPNIDKLVGLARKRKTLLVSSACQHTVDDPEFKVFPPHCLRGTPGAELIPEARLDHLFRIPNDAKFHLPANVLENQQVLLEKQVLDVFQNPHAADLVKRLGIETEFVVFGVVTEYCVRLAAKGLMERGHRVAVVSEAIETLKREEGQKTTDELCTSGARLISTEQAIAEVESVRG
jgi:nicotinamidase/pyrazinamidase